MSPLAALLAGGALGVASAPHCAAMCGSLAAYCGAATRRGGLGYHLGRLGSYALLGALAGGGAALGATALPAKWASALLSWALAAALLVGARRLLRAAPEPGLTRLGIGARSSWLDRLRDRALGLARRPVAFGAATALLPCGALYAAALLAAGTGDALGGAAAMIGFAGASGAGLVALAALARRLRPHLARDAVLRQVVASALIVGALVLAARPVPALLTPEPAPCHVSR